MKKRILSILLAICMVAGLLPGTALTAAAAESADEMTIYFQNNWLWDDVQLYFWGSAGTNPDWPGNAMEKVGNDGYYDIYKATVPTDVTGIIVNGVKNDGSGGRDQTPDITSGWYDGICYYMLWDSANASNTVGSENIAVIYPEAVPEEPAPTYVAEVEGQQFENLAEAIAHAQTIEGSTVKLLDHVTLDTYIKINSGKFTIDLAGKTWESSSWALYIGGDADVTITSTADGGVLRTTGSGYPTILLYDTAQLEITGGTVENTGLTDAVDMSASGNPTEARLIISGGRVATNDYTAVTAFGSSVTVTGGTLESKRYHIEYHTGVIDLSNCAAPAGMTITTGFGVTAATVGRDILLPAGYCLLDRDGNEVTTLVAGSDYTVAVDETSVPVYVAEVGDRKFENLAEAIRHAEGINGSTVKLLDHVSLKAEIYINSGKFTIDLNGFVWENSNALIVQGTAEVTLTSTMEGGVLRGTGSGWPTVVLGDTAQLEITGGTVEHTGSTVVIDMSFAGNPTQSQLIISGGKVATKGTIAVSAFGSSVTVTGGTLESTTANIAYQSGVIDLSNCAAPAGIKIEISYNVTEAIVGTDILLPAGYCFVDEEGNEVTTLVTWGTYTVAVDETPAPDPTPTYVAEVNGQGFENLAEAIAHAETVEGSVLKLLTGVQGAYQINGGTFTLDLNGQTLRSDDYIALWIRDENAVITVVDSATGGSIESGSANGYAVCNWGTLTIESGTVKGAYMAVSSDGTLTVTGGTFEAPDKALYIADGTARIEGGTVVGNVFGFVDYTITGGHFTADYIGINKDGGVLTITGGTFDIDEFRTFAGEISVTGGSFTIDPSAHVPVGYAATYDDATGYYTVAVGETPAPTPEYATKAQLEAAIAALEAKLAQLETQHGADVSELSAALETLRQQLAALDETYATDEALADAIAALNTTLTELTNRITTLEATYATKAELESEIARLEQMIADLELAYGGDNAGLVAELAALQARLEALETALADLDGTYATDEALTALRTELEALAARVTALEETFATKAQLESEIARLEQMIEDLELAYGGDNAGLVAELESLRQQLADLDNNGFATDTELEDAVVLLNDKIAILADRITALETTYATKAELQEAIEELKAAIAAGDAANAEALENAVAALEQKLAEAVAALEKAYQDADTALKSALEALISDAKTALETAIAELEERVEKNETDIAALQAALQTAIDELNAAIAAGDAANAEALAEAVATLEKALADAVAALEQADADNKAALEALISDAKTALEAAVAKLRQDLEDAVADLENADKENAEALAQAIQDLSAAIEAAKTVSAAEDAKIRAELAAAQAALQSAISSLSAQLNATRTQLLAAIAAGDKALEEKITALAAALEAAVAAAEAADEALKVELNARIDQAVAALEAAIAAVAENLTQAQQELQEAIDAGDKKLHIRVESLGEAMGAALAAAQAADEALKMELNARIDQAIAALEAAIAQTQKNLDEVKAQLMAKDEQLAAKDAQLHTLVIVAIVLGGMGVCGCAALMIFLMVDKRKKAL